MIRAVPAIVAIDFDFVILCLIAPGFHRYFAHNRSLMRHNVCLNNCRINQLPTLVSRFRHYEANLRSNLGSSSTYGALSPQTTVLYSSHLNCGQYCRTSRSCMSAITRTLYVNYLDLRYVVNQTGTLDTIMFTQNRRKPWSEVWPGSKGATVKNPTIPPSFQAIAQGRPRKLRSSCVIGIRPLSFPDINLVSRRSDGEKTADYGHRHNRIDRKYGDKAQQGRL